MANFFRWWNTLARATRWQLVTAVAVVVGVVEVRYGVATPEMSKQFVERAGYWLTGSIAVLFALAVAKEVRRRGWTWRWLGTLARGNWVGLLVAVLGAVFLQVHEPHDFKVLFDEHVLAGTAYNMHFEREATYPSYAQMVNGRIYTLGAGLDKRPLLYPFLVAITHDLTGYRPENSFVVNAVVGWVLLLLIYAVGAKMGGARVGWLGQFLIIALPLVAQNATGGGYDLLNMTMLCALLLAAWYYWRQPGTAGLDVMVLTGVLLANCRYESMLYLGALPVLVVLKWVREKTAGLTWMAALSPLLILLPLLHNEVMMQGGGYFQTTAENFMNVRHIPDNLAHAVHFLFSPDREDENSLWLAGLGTVALLVTLIGILRRLPKKWADAGPGTVLLIMLGGILTTTGLSMLFFWGHWDEPIVARFSLPLQLAFVWCILYVAVELLRGRRLPGVVLAIFGVYAVVSSAPVSSRAFATSEHQSYLAYRWVRQYLQAHADPSVLVITRATVMCTLFGQPSVPMGIVNVAPEKVIESQKLGMYREVWAVQEVAINHRYNTWLEYPSARLDQRLVLQTLAEYPIRPEIHIRISKVVGFDPKRPAGTVKLPGETGTATLGGTDAAWDSQSAGIKGSEVMMTQRPADLPLAVPTLTELPADPADLEMMMMHQLPGG
jgi:hypothetical protein